MSDVPCNGCTLCCQRDLIFLHEDLGDDPSQYECEVMDSPHGPVGVLKRAANGDCVYLDRARGCTIYERRPLICREFDCAAMYKRMGKQGRIDALEQGIVSKAVLDRGQQLLKNGYRPADLANRRRLMGLKLRSGA